MNAESGQEYGQKGKRIKELEKQVEELEKEPYIQKQQAIKIKQQEEEITRLRGALKEYKEYIDMLIRLGYIQRTPMNEKLALAGEGE